MSTKKQGKAEKRSGVPGSRSKATSKLKAAPPFTPGPWEVRPAETKAEYDVMTRDGYYVATTFEMFGVDDRLETLANAHLIAAAPDLLKALRDLDDMYAASGKCWDAARRAIRLATTQPTGGS